MQQLLPGVRTLGSALLAGRAKARQKSWVTGGAGPSHPVTTHLSRAVLLTRRTSSRRAGTTRSTSREQRRTTWIRDMVTARRHTVRFFSLCSRAVSHPFEMLAHERTKTNQTLSTLVLTQATGGRRCKPSMQRSPGTFALANRPSSVRRRTAPDRAFTPMLTHRTRLRTQ